MKEGDDSADLDEVAHVASTVKKNSDKMVKGHLDIVVSFLAEDCGQEASEMITHGDENILLYPRSVGDVWEVIKCPFYASCASK